MVRAPGSRGRGSTDVRVGGVRVGGGVVMRHREAESGAVTATDEQRVTAALQ
jgi:hypothetical protein